MRTLRLVASVAAALAVAASLALGAGAAPKTGCPADGWQELELEVVAATVWPLLLDKSVWSTPEIFLELAVRPFDKNGDNKMCIKQIWGDHLNANSHWFKVGVEILGSPTVFTLPRDNNANASNR